MPIKNYGVILEPLQETTYLFGRATKVVDNITLSEPDWFRYLTDGEEQAGLYFDSLGCVSFSGLNSVESIIEYQLQNHMIHGENIQWLQMNGYFNSRGRFECSDRFTAKMSGTTKKGNSGERVGNSMRHNGLIPEARWPFPNRQQTPVFDWDDYYQEIPQELIDLGKEFVKRIDVQYEAVVNFDTDDLKKALLHSPLQVYVHAWGKTVGGVFQRTDKVINHAVTLFKPEWNIRDHYKLEDIFDKQLVGDFNFYPVAMKYTVTSKSTMRRLIKGDQNERVYFLGSDNKLYHIGGTESFDEGQRAGLWGNWGEIEILPQVEADAFTKGNVIGFIS